MNRSSAMRASLMLSLTAILSGCGASTGQPLDAAAARIGIAGAEIARVRQPQECREDWSLLDRDEIVGHAKLAVIDTYEAYITDTINPAKRRCWQFNENIHAGVATPPAGSAR